MFPEIGTRYINFPSPNSCRNLTHRTENCFKFGASENLEVPKEPLPSHDSSEVDYQKYSQRVLATTAKSKTIGIGMKSLLRTVQSSTTWRLWKNSTNSEHAYIKNICISNQGLINQFQPRTLFHEGEAGYQFYLQRIQDIPPKPPIPKPAPIPTSPESHAAYQCYLRRIEQAPTNSLVMERTPP